MKLPSIKNETEQNPHRGKVRVIILTPEQQKDIEALLWLKKGAFACLEAQPNN